MLFFHWTRNASSPLTSVAPIIFSGSRPLSNGDALSFSLSLSSLLLLFLSFSLTLSLDVDFSFSSSECFDETLWFDSFLLVCSLLLGFFDFSRSFSFSFVNSLSLSLSRSLSFSFVDSFTLSSRLSDSVLRDFFSSGFFVELVVESSFELLLMRRFFVFAFLAYKIDNIFH